MVRGLYAITQENLMLGDLLLKKAEAALRGGCKLLQYRNKSSRAQVQVKQAITLRALCDRYGAKLIVNDSVNVAEASEAHGVHLGQKDESIENARKRLGPDAIIGATCHGSLLLAQAACDMGADYVAFGRFYPSQTKPLAPPAELALLSEMRKRLTAVTVAIGGINMDNAPTLIAAGADCLAVSYDLFRGDDLVQIERRAAHYISLFNTAQEQQ